MLKISLLSVFSIALTATAFAQTEVPETMTIMGEIAGTKVEMGRIDDSVNIKEIQFPMSVSCRCLAASGHVLKADTRRLNSKYEYDEFSLGCMNYKTKTYIDYGIGSRTGQKMISGLIGCNLVSDPSPK